MKQIAIIGGGITGLVAAYQLKQEIEQGPLEARITIYEASHRLGGKILTHREQGFVMEGGPDSILARKPAGVGLIRELGLESELVGTNPDATKTYIVGDGHLHQMPAGTNMGIPVEMEPFLKTTLLSPDAKLRTLAELFVTPSKTEDDESLGSFLRRRVGDALVDRVAEPLLAGIYAGRVDDLSLLATFPQFRATERTHGSLIAGFRRQRRLGKAVTTRSGRSTFVTLRGGLQTLIDRLAEVLGPDVDVEFGTSVNSLAKHPSGGYELHLNGPVNASTVVADAVLLAVPAFAAGQILKPIIPSAAKLLQIPYASTATVIVGYPKSQIDVSLDASGFVIPPKERRAITASTWVSSKWPHTTPDDYVMLRCYVGRAGDEEVLRHTDEELVVIVQQELHDLVGISAPIAFSKVTRWNRSMPQYRVGHLDLVEDIEQELSQSGPGVFVAGGTYRGVGIPDCISQGKHAAHQISNHLLK